MNPYEKTAEEMKRQSEGPKRFAKKLVGGAATLGAIAGSSSFSSILSRAAPFLSEYIPENLAIKGLSKVSPKIGKFIQDSIGEGYDFKEVKDFLGEQINESQQSEKAKENRNVIQQYSPELYQFLEQEIKNGRAPLEAGALAQNNSKFKNIIKKMEGDHKTNFSSILQSIFGQTSTQSQGQSKQPISMEQFLGSQPQGNSSPQQSGQGQQALMAILQKINQARNGQ